MSFSDDLRRFREDLKRKHDAVFAGVVTEVHRSIVEGSEITGAPGQPVETGHLRASWNTRFLGPHTAVISTNVEYAPIIEENLRGARFRSKRGGAHSVALTVLGFQNIIDHVVRRVTGSR